jgi:hypothetical protein
MYLLTPPPRSVCPFDRDFIKDGLTLQKAVEVYSAAQQVVLADIATGRRPDHPYSHRLANKYAEQATKIASLL